jgi:hypothetical protein
MATERSISRTEKTAPAAGGTAGDIGRFTPNAKKK